jgi:hypothetical protein
MDVRAAVIILLVIVFVAIEWRDWKNIWKGGEK